jgi:hypothetical protein
MDIKQLHAAVFSMAETPKNKSHAQEKTQTL